MQVDIGQERADPRTMRGAPLAIGVYTVFHHAGAQPQAYQPQNARIGDPVLEHPFQP